MKALIEMKATAGKHTGLENHNSEQMLTEFLFLSELSIEYLNCFVFAVFTRQGWKEKPLYYKMS